MKEIRKALWACTGIDPKSSKFLPAMRLVLCPRKLLPGGEWLAVTSSTVGVGWGVGQEDSPHLSSRQGELRGIQMALCIATYYNLLQCPGAEDYPQPGLTQCRPPREHLQREGGAHISRLQGKDHSREGIWHSTSAPLSTQAKNSLLAHVENNLQAAETPRVPRLLSIVQFSSVFTETLLCARYCAKFRMRTLPFMESQSLKRKKINQAKCQTRGKGTQFRFFFS